MLIWSSILLFSASLVSFIFVISFLMLFFYLQSFFSFFFFLAFSIGSLCIFIFIDLCIQTYKCVLKKGYFPLSWCRVLSIYTHKRPTLMIMSFRFLMSFSFSPLWLSQERGMLDSPITNVFLFSPAYLVVSVLYGWWLWYLLVFHNCCSFIMKHSFQHHRRSLFVSFNAVLALITLFSDIRSIAHAFLLFTLPWKILIHACIFQPFQSLNFRRLSLSFLIAQGWILLSRPIWMSFSSKKQVFTAIYQYNQYVCIVPYYSYRLNYVLLILLLSVLCVCSAFSFSISVFKNVHFFFFLVVSFTSLVLFWLDTPFSYSSSPCLMRWFQR